ncbi:uncharacterized protein LOC122851115 [Aphidius gifuensis]|uniref:uncharacterized protein LOC122851115 n=1 Tax=Aphidius gifuensis TaxID=684658 RepID=UPI001CDCEC95|nr:uncharacterized protein LOC122851115 [Aphidius gifuensis]
MDDQCHIISESGEAKKRFLSQVNKAAPSRKYMCLIYKGVPYRLATESKIGDHDHFCLERIRPANDRFPSKNVAYVTKYGTLYNTKIDSLADRLLAKILMYVPSRERPKLTLVCEQWKRVVMMFRDDDSWFDVKKLELIYWRYDKYLTSDGGYDFVKSQINRCGRYLTKLDLTAYGDSEIMLFIKNSCPNLVTLRLRFTEMKEIILANSFTCLPKLKLLTIIFQSMKPLPLLPIIVLINSLRNVADTLIQLSLLYWIDDLRDIPDFTAVIDDVLHDLNALKTLELAGVKVSDNVINYLKNNKILYVNHTTHLLQYLSTFKTFTDIKILRISDCKITNDTLYSIANTFQNLETLEIYSTWVTDDGVLALSKMNNLQILNFHGQCNYITDSSIILLKNLIKLGLPSSKKITDDSVITVLKNSPKMSVLDVYGTNVTAELVKKAAEISRSRKQRLIFCIESMPDIQQYDSPYFDLHTYQKINGERRLVSVSASDHAFPSNSSGEEPIW